jgi:hypothetical protein
MGNRPVGKPRQRWQEDVMENLKKSRKLKTGRRQLRTEEQKDLAEKAKIHKGL